VAHASSFIVVLYVFCIRSSCTRHGNSEALLGLALSRSSRYWLADRLEFGPYIKVAVG